ncbi:T9SS type A sorting domain-containing protein [bacterium]|nr:T9SS type A sorting domain-containing protein [bacterium]
MKRATGLLLSLICFACILPAFADLHDTANSADYLIISSSEIIQQNEWITDLADWRDDHGRTSMIVSTEEIFTEFGDGTPLDTTLKEFLHYAYNNWQEPQLQDVFIIGHHDVVPSHEELLTVGVLDTFIFISDYFYSTAIETEDYVPLLAVGRLPWSPTFSSPLPDYYAKIIGYETAPEADWQRRVHVISDSGNFGLTTDWETIAESIISEIPSSYQINRDFLGAPADDPNFANIDTIQQSWNQGNYILSFVGYGNGEFWSSNFNIDTSDIGGLNNASHLPIVKSYSASNEYQFTDSDAYVGSIPYTLLANPDGGVIGYFANSTITWAGAGRTYQRFALSALTNTSVETLGEAWRSGLDSVASSYTTFPLHSSITVTVFSSILFGDPGLRLPDRTSPIGESRQTSLPQSIELLGNYPNPFNSTTTIRYKLPNSAKVILSIYNVEGREVATLADGPVSAGEHSIQWNAAGQASGIYFVTLKAGGSMQTHKMVFLK